MTDEEESENLKDVYAHFGLAIYLAQVLEHGIVNALLITDLMPRRIGKPITQSEWHIEVDDFMGAQFEETLGRLIKALRSVVPVPQALEEALKESLALRNSLAHRFFREKAELFLSHSGQKLMVQELIHAQKIFQMADQKLTEFIAPLMDRYGITGEMVKAEEERALTEARA